MGSQDPCLVGSRLLERGKGWPWVWRREQELIKSGGFVFQPVSRLSRSLAPGAQRANKQSSRPLYGEDHRLCVTSPQLQIRGCDLTKDEWDPSWVTEATWRDAACDVLRYSGCLNELERHRTGCMTSGPFWNFQATRCLSQNVSQAF